MSSSIPLRTCPACGAQNSTFSLFCAECGAALEPAGSDETSTFRPPPNEDDSQATAAFTPAIAPRDVEREAAPDDTLATRVTPPVRSTVQPYAPTWENEREPEAPPPAWAGTPAAHRTVTIGARPESMRGFFLGLAAALLILAVFGAWSWAAVLSSDARDSIRDVFGFIG